MASFTFTFAPVYPTKAWTEPDVLYLRNPYLDRSVPISDPPSLANKEYFEIPNRLNMRNSTLPSPRYTVFRLHEQVNVGLVPNGSASPPPDGALSGRLFGAWFAESPNGIAGWNSVPGFSAIQFFIPVHLGAYLAVFERDGGGRIAWHFMVEP